MPRELRLFIILVWLLVLADIVLEIVNGRFWVNDFRVYHMAAGAFIHHRPVYGEVFGEDTGLFKYAPVVLFLFVPYALLPLKFAAILHLLLDAAVLSVCFVRIERLLMRHVFSAHPPRILLRAMIGLLCIATLLVRELHVGNINLWLVLLIVMASEARCKGDNGASGILLGIAVVIKPYLLLLLIPPLVRRDRALIIGALSAIVLGALIPLMLGPHEWLASHQAWIASMQRHMGTLESFNTIEAIASHFLHVVLPSFTGAGMFITAAIALAFATVIRIRRPEGNATSSLEFWIPFALVPNLVITDQEHFMFSLPLILFMLGYLFNVRDRIVLACFLLAMMLYATRSSDLWGSDLFDRMELHGVLGVGNLLLIGTALLAHVRHRSRAIPRLAEKM